MDATPPCPACDSSFTLFAQKVIGRRSGNKFSQYACLECRTFFNPSGYEEPDFQSGLDFQYLFDQRDKHTALLSQLCMEIRARAPGLQSVLEIGFGCGLLLNAFKAYGHATHGYEINPSCYEFAKQTLGLDVINGYFPDENSQFYDLIASVMVFEHLKNPRKTFIDMKSRLRPDGAIYISVPFLHRSEWRYLRTAGTAPGDTPPDPFYDNDVHINHFSVDGLTRMGLSLGARSADYWVSQDTWEHSAGSYHGILFRF